MIHSKNNFTQKVHTLKQRFPTVVPQNLRAPSMASKGSAKSNQETETKRHLRPLNAFSGLLLLVCPKCICGQSSTPNSAGGAYTAPPGPLTCCPLVTKNLFSLLAIGLEFLNFPKQISG